MAIICALLCVIAVRVWRSTPATRGRHTPCVTSWRWWEGRTKASLFSTKRSPIGRYVRVQLAQHCTTQRPEQCRSFQFKTVSLRLEKAIIMRSSPVIGGSRHKYHFCHDKSFVMTNVCFPWQTCLSQQILVATKVILSRHTQSQNIVVTVWQSSPSSSPWYDL